MEQKKQSMNRILLLLAWLLEGAVVGFGAILPGISGGTLCVAFGMYHPLIELVSNLKAGLKKHGIMLGTFLLGVIIGFVGLSGLAAVCMEKNSAFVTCVFIGFILGTVPGLWQEAGQRGRTRSAYVSLCLSFVLMLTVLGLLKSTFSVTIAPGIAAYLFCGLLWGLSIIVPGLSSSSLLLFFGLYQPMLEGISAFKPAVLLPMVCGILLCVLLLSKTVHYAYQKWYAAMSHGVLGIVAATAVMILPTDTKSFGAAVANLCFIIGGAALSYFFTTVCSRLKENQEQER